MWRVGGTLDSDEPQKLEHFLPSLFNMNRRHMAKIKRHCLWNLEGRERSGIRSVVSGNTASFIFWGSFIRTPFLTNYYLLLKRLGMGSGKSQYTWLN